MEVSCNILYPVFLRKGIIYSKLSLKLNAVVVSVGHDVILKVPTRKQLLTTQNKQK